MTIHSWLTLSFTLLLRDYPRSKSFCWNPKFISLFLGKIERSPAHLTLQTITVDCVSKYVLLVLQLSKRGCINFSNTAPQVCSRESKTCGLFSLPWSHLEGNSEVGSVYNITKLLKVLVSTQVSLYLLESLLAPLLHHWFFPCVVKWRQNREFLLFPRMTPDPELPWNILPLE